MRRTHRRGNALTTALTLTTLLGFGALSVDVGMIRLAASQLQQSVDAAAFSGVQELDGTTAGISRASSIAAAIAQANPVHGGTMSLDAVQVITGAYDPATHAWDPYAEGDDPKTINALRVSLDTGSIASGLGAVAFGIDGYTVTARSQSKRRLGAQAPGASTCYLPLAIPSCLVSATPAGANPAPLTLKFTSSTVDTASWGLVDHNPNSNDVRDQLWGQCGSGPLTVGGTLYVNEGKHTTALQAIADILNGKGSAGVVSTWDSALYGAMPSFPGSTAKVTGGGTSTTSSSVSPTHWGNVLEGPVAIVDAGTSCSAVSFTGTKPVVGVAWGVIYDVATTGPDAYVKIQVDRVGTHAIWGAKADPSATVYADNVAVPSDPEMASW